MYVRKQPWCVTNKSFHFLCRKVGMPTTAKQKHLHFLCRFKDTLSEYFSLLLEAKKKAPHFTRDFRSTLTTLKSFFLQIVHIRTHTRLKEGSLENYRTPTISENKKWVHIKIRLGFLRFLIGFFSYCLIEVSRSTK